MTQRNRKVTVMDDYIKEQIKLWDSLCKEQADFYHKASVWSGLSDAAYWVMFSVCWKQEKISQSDLCAENYFPKQTINSAVTKLLKQEFVTLIASDDNKKRKLIKLTTQGVAFCKQYVEPIFEVERESFRQCDRDEIDQMLSTMKKQLNFMKEKTENLWQ